MSFRGRLALFFLLIVVIPIAAIALLVVDVTQDSQAGKSDAALSTALTTALARYETDVLEAQAQATELLTDAGVEPALRSGDEAEIRRVAAAAGRARGLEYLAITTPDGGEITVIDSPSTVASAVVPANVQGTGEYELRASVTGPTEYVEEVSDLTGLEVALVSDGEVVAGSRAIGDC